MSAIKQYFRTENVLHVIRLGLTSNEKICGKYEMVVQTYHFDKAQFEFIKNGGTGIKIQDGFLKPELTENNCGNCPLRHKGCYTFKFPQAMGNRSSLNAAVNKFQAWENIPTYDELDITEVGQMCENQYIRFGAYGNPDTMPLPLVKFMVEKSRIHTGYTHNWQDPEKDGYLDYFMASAHQNSEIWKPTRKDVRHFVTDGTGVQCPASDEYKESTGKVVTCSQCGLCSGRLGKGKGNVRINSH